jgi:DNA-binding transcriptional ArsR family regulator
MLIAGLSNTEILQALRGRSQPIAPEQTLCDSGHMRTLSALQLAGGPSTIDELTAIQGRLTEGTVRRHLIVLKRKGLVDRHELDRRLTFTLTDAGRVQLDSMPAEPTWTQTARRVR